MNKRVSILSAAAALALSGVALAAGPIGINYVDFSGEGDNGVQNGRADSLLPGELAGAPGYEQVGWNNMGRWGQTVPLNDSSGTVSGATTTWDSANTWRDGAGTASPNAKLMHGYLDATGEANNNTSPGYGFFSNANKPDVFLTNLSGWLAAQGASSYNVVVYTDGDEQTGRRGEYWLQAGSGGDPPGTLGADLTSHIFVTDVSNFSGTFVEAPLSANTLETAAPGNFFVFTGLSADSFILRTEEHPSLTVTDTARRAQINGIQIIAVVPEPGVISMLGLTAVGLMMRRRR
jgi:hypothetical protein